MSKFPHLAAPLPVGAKTYKNRIVAAPIYCGTFLNIPGLDGVLKKGMLDRAKGGAATVTLGETAVDFVGASREPFPPIDYTDLNDPTMPKMKALVSEIQAQGALALIELSHCGESVEPIPGVEYGLGPMSYTREDGMRIYGMDEAQMREVTQHFITAALWMKEAGMDGIMIHAGHGWLLHQFLSPRTNRREDAYGGSLENRARFPLALLSAVREAVGKDFIIEMRVSGEECMGENGMHLNETVAFCKLAQKYVDLIHVSVGVYRNPILSGEFSSMFQPHGLNMDASAAVKKAVDVPVAVVGGITSPELAEEMIATGKCDLVALARPLTADPEFPRKALEGREDDISQCIRCFKCFMGPLEGVDISEMPKLFGCSVNPSAFCYDKELLASVPETSKKVLVVGGGVAGMTAAITACDRGHQVTLAERGDKLGGLLFFTDTDYYKKDMKKFKDLLVRRVEKRNIRVLLNQEITPEYIASCDADAIILAIGSSPLVLPIQGIENAVQALELYPDNSKAGKRVIMVGGGLVGCEVGIDLARDGREVTIVEMGDRVAPESYPMHRVALVDEMERLVKVRTGLKCTSIRRDGITCLDKEGKEVVLEGDTVVHALGMRANGAAVEALRAAAKVPCTVVGDCVRAAKIYEAGLEGWTAAMKL